MKDMKRYFLALLLLFSIRVWGQKVELINVDQLYGRLRGGGDTAFVVNFWATWCGSCVNELPDFERLGVTYKQEKLKVLLISMDYKSKRKTSVLPFVKRKGIKSEVFLLDEKDPQVFINRIDSSWSGGLPATLMWKKGRRTFFERELTYPELKKEYLNSKKS
jgi:thiol-disulfide isomerase/thioredoxin